MIADWRRWLPRTIAGQLTSVVVAAVLFGVCVASAVMFSLIYSGGVGPSRDTLVQVRAARIAAVVNGLREAKTPAEAAALIRRANVDPVRVTWAAPPAGPAAAPANSIVADVEDDLARSWRVETTLHAHAGADAEAVYVKLDNGRSLRFAVAPFSGVGKLLFGQTIFTLGVITSIILGVSAYAVRSVTAPLSSIASAARAFGRPGVQGADLDEAGPIEIAQAARALNEMRARVRSMVDERTRMLAAVSHDLRTPLTRLRLRIDRLADDSAKAEMLGEIFVINEMLSETLAYMREVGQTEATSPTDLPSLVQTICGQFADAGHDVVYRGPDRLAIVCRPHALTRALSNLVDNAVKFGAHVEVGVEAGGSEVCVEVRDDGPGVAPEIMGRVFEPFFKGDDARGQDQGGGFGLGLSIVREIAERHGGAVELINAEPSGLVARLRLPVAG
jgi:signal transduction histidine kinase